MQFKTRRLKQLLIWLLVLCTPLQAEESVLTLADAQGDWGLLAPFVHSPRGPGYVYSSFVFDTLLWKDVHGKLQPLLASHWSYEPSTQCYAFALNQQARWHDGQAVSNADVIFSFTYMQKHAYRFVDFSPIKSIQEQKGQVEVCLEQPHAPFLSNVLATLPIIPKHIYGAIDEPLRFNHAQAAVGSGPYRLLEYSKAKGYYVLERHSDYHLGAPKYAQVRILRMNPHAALAAIQRQQIDYVSVPHELLEQYEKTDASLIQRVSNHPVRILFNHADLFADVTRRQALARLIDRQQLLGIIYPQGAQLAQVGYRQDRILEGLESYVFDPEHAQQQLIQSGWKKNKQGVWLDASSSPVRLSLLSDPNSELLARALAQLLEQQGFALDIRLEQDVQLTQRLREKRFDLALLSASHEGDPDRFRLLMTGQQQRSDHFVGNAELLRLLDEQVRTVEPIQREALLVQAEHIYNQELPSYPLINPHSFAAYRAAKLTPEFTQGGIAMGIPLPLNKLHLFFDE